MLQQYYYDFIFQLLSYTEGENQLMINAITLYC